MHRADTSSFTQWMLGTSFPTYSWNTVPVDGTDIERALVAIGRSFPFLIELAQVQPTAAGGEENEAAEHFHSFFPLLLRQRELFTILVESRRERHRELNNEGRKVSEFHPNDVVMVRN